MSDDIEVAGTGTKNILTEVRERVEECLVKAETHFGSRIPRCAVKFDLTGTKGGTANFAKKELRFNRKLLQENREEYFSDTIPHEVAHIVQRWKYGYAVKSHGNEWKKIMIEVFGIAPKRTHNMDVSSVKRKTKEYKYTCACPGKSWSVGAIKHSRMQRNTSVCAKCLTSFIFQGKGSSAVKAPVGLKEMELD